MFARLLTVVFGYAFGVYFFYRGFLLTRHTLTLNSTCDEIYGQSTNASSCWGKARFDRAILLVVDALRYDFVAAQPASTRVYHNNFVNVRSLLANQSRNSLLLRFVADPPTTTLQRLKALTTGSLPTFVDAGANFAAFPFPSFNVKDLDTVDNGIVSHLISEVRSSDWQLLIAHFLGVDHCGHTYGPNHPRMAQKLLQMDRIIKDVIDVMDDRTVLFVLGDHGMTKTGDHGGESAGELNAALFVYSHLALHRPMKNLRKTVAQIDFVPSLALLLGVPIPFSNLGSVIPELFMDDEYALRASRINIYQVIRYTETYLSNFHDALLSERFASLLNIFYSLDSEELTVDKCLDIVGKVGQIFANCWAKFHLGWMMLGILAVGETFLWSLVSIFGDADRWRSDRTIFLKSSIFGLFLWAVLAQNESIPPIIGIVLCMEVALHLHTLLHVALNADTLPSCVELLTCFVFSAHCLSAFSNSYVVNEDAVSQFFCQTLFLLFTMNHYAKMTKFRTLHHTRRHKRHGMLYSNGSLRRCLQPSAIYFAAVVLVRSGTLFKRCREEQLLCSASFFSQPFASLFDQSEKAQRVVTALFSLSCLFFIPWYYMKKCGHLDEDSIVAVICEFCAKCGFVFVGIFWLAQWIAEHAVTGPTTTLVQVAPRIVYFVAALFVILYLSNPLFLSVFYPDLTGFPVGSNTDVPDVFRFLRSNWKHLCDWQQDKTVCVAGFATAFSGSFVTLFRNISIVAVLVLGDGFSFSMVTLFVLLLSLSDLNSDSLVSSTVFLCEICYRYFYAFGHQPCFSSIPWEAAFIGVPGNVACNFVPAFLIVFHVAASVVLCVFAVPLQIVWKMCRRKHFMTNFSTKNEVEYVMHESGFEKDLLRCDLIFLASLGLKTLFVMMAAAIHRRHLMVWKIFAPKFLFEATLLL
ncbi:unnamed protein product, partial [Soboliphyme baturini]|uniref:GPI ethanolamine phosphate transferase 3 n=1 Tax=Soboliphyme baturini TaxID=241478 RepID=A0A183ISI4_9BILA